MFKSELRKLLTIRASYVIVLLVILLAGLDVVMTARNAALATESIGAGLLEGLIRSALNAAAMFAAIYAALVLSHEYRYNLIYHTLTVAKTRSQVLVAKIGTR
ncbi:MAG: hypothetical protein WD467_03730 [Candidatus Saccharimonadales bacterium]